ncbi:MAG: peptidoglycan DD-metalloendopeptidase family protein [Chitinophagales bacterium]
MALKKPDWKQWRDKLKNVYRFQIVDEKSYDVKMVLELNRLNVLVGVGLVLAFFTVLNFLFIAFTPLKQYIPGYGSSSGRRELVSMSMKTEELGDIVNAQQKYVANLQNILNDKVVVDVVQSNVKKSKVDTGILSIKTTDESKFVQEVEKGLKNAELLESVRDTKASPLGNLQLEKPVSGKVLTKFSDNNNNVTFSAANNEEVKAILSGNVILTGNTPESGHYMVVQAENQLVYILKNNSQLLKKTGNFVNAGETIAISGKNNALKNYICVLELWYRGQAIDPQKFIK